MKKFILFSLFVSGVFCANVGMAEVQMVDVGGKKVPCFGFNPGGSMHVYDNCQTLWQECTASHADIAVCKYKNSRNDSDGYVCAATECDEPDWLLWTTNTRAERQVVDDHGGMIEEKKVGSQGICYSRAWLQEQCELNCDKCPHIQGGKRYRCELMDIKIRNEIQQRKWKDVLAFVGERACMCVEYDDGRPVTCEEQYPDTEPDYRKKRICCEVKKEWDNVKNECPCEEGKKFDYQKRDCVEIPVEVQPPVNTDPCAQYSGNPEAYACCKKGLTWDAANKTCMCPEGYIWDKDKKDCVEIKEEPCNGVDCRKYYLDINLICPDGTRVYGHQYYKIDKNYLKEHGYDSFAEYEAANPVPCQDRYDHDVCMQELFCKGHEKPADSAPSGNLNTSNVPQQQPVVNKPDDKAAAVTRAKKVLDDFYTYAKDDKNRSVWKDSEGNFNTIRLASDLTAGVVLGTVGGVVSGVVIKKKQVEKGFDALHCTVGGQTVADWGDTFNVGLR